jgi:hypothetical protein
VFANTRTLSDVIDIFSHGPASRFFPDRFLSGQDGAVTADHVASGAYMPTSAAASLLLYA